MDRDEVKSLVRRARKHPRRKELWKDLGIAAGATGAALGTWRLTRNTKMGKLTRTLASALPFPVVAAIYARPAKEFKRRLDELDKKKS